MSNLKLVTGQEIKAWKVPEVSEKVHHVSEAFGEIVAQWRKRKEEIVGFPTESWPVFNQTFGGTRPGEVVVLTGETGSGKSTFGILWLMDTIKQKRPAFLISLELRLGAIARKIATMIVGKPFDEFDQTDISGVGEIMKDLPLWIMAGSGMTDERFLLKAIQYAAFEKGCGLTLLDHLDYINKYSPNKFANESQVIGMFMRRLSGVTHQTASTVLLIVHPSKLRVHGTNRREISMDELKGSSSIKQEADAVLSIYQPNEKDQRGMILRFQKIRDDKFSKFKNAFIKFDYDPYRAKLTETSLFPEWGSPKKKGE